MMSPLHDLAGVLIVADDEHAVQDATSAVTLAGARALAVSTWSAAAQRIGQMVSPAAVLFDAKGIDERRIAEVLPEVTVGAGPARSIVAFAPDQLDQVTSFLVGTGAELLCDPTPGERIAALVLALRPDTLVVSDGREEAARVARIHAEVARFTETIAQLASPAPGSHAASHRTQITGDRTLGLGQPTGDVMVTSADVRRVIRARRLRDEVFGLPGLFEDPAWDMLLDLFAAELERSQVSVSSLCIAAAVAPTTALRWINKLIAADLFERRPDAFDRRRAYVALTARALSALQNYVGALNRANLSMA